MQQQTPATVRAFMRERGMNQQELAVSAKVSQSTVSRALQRGAQRAGRGRKQLFIYIENEYRKDAATGERLPKAVAGAFYRVWDGSPPHATAIARVIKALRGLRPKRPLA